LEKVNPFLNARQKTPMGVLNLNDMIKQITFFFSNLESFIVFEKKKLLEALIKIF